MMKCKPAELAPPAGASGVVAGKAKAGIWVRFETGALLGFATILFLTATAIMLVEGVGRSFFDESYFWAEEAVRYLMVWAFFLTLGAAGTAGNHIRTELLVERMPAGIRKAMNVLASVVGICFSGALLYASFPQIHRYYTMGMMTESNLDLPMWFLFLAMPLGATLLLVYYIRCLISVLRGEDPFTATHGPTGSEL